MLRRKPDCLPATSQWAASHAVPLSLMTLKLQRLYTGALLLIYLLCSAQVQADWARAEAAIMGTEIRAEVWHEDAALAQKGVVAVMDEMRRIDRLMSPYKPQSELSQINRYAADEPVVVSTELYALIKRSMEFSVLTGGAFDITFASVGHLYDYREHRKPDQQQIEEKLSAINYRHVELNDKDRYVRFARRGVKIDLGGIAKGHAVDNALQILRDLGIEHALVTAGGDTGLLGDRLGRPWMVGIKHPRKSGAMAAMLPLQDEALSTSGDYERFFEEDGVRYHHILNPSTGKSVGEVTSVSILGPDATTADALSTSVFVLGVEQGMALVNRLAGIEAIIVDKERRLFYSLGLEKPSRPSAETNTWMK